MTWNELVEYMKKRTDGTSEVYVRDAFGNYTRLRDTDVQFYAADRGDRVMIVFGE